MCAMKSLSHLVRSHWVDVNLSCLRGKLEPFYMCCIRMSHDVVDVCDELMLQLLRD
jgi:hypothetical protein